MIAGGNGSTGVRVVGSYGSESRVGHASLRLISDSSADLRAIPMVEEARRSARGRSARYSIQPLETTIRGDHSFDESQPLPLTTAHCLRRHSSGAVRPRNPLGAAESA